MSSNTIYDSSKDTLYILIYKLGKSVNEIWYAIEYVNFLKQIKNKTNNITFKALKIFVENHNAEKEMKSNELLIYNKKKSDKLNYPQGTLKHKNKLILIYDVMCGSLYDIFVKKNKTFDVQTIKKLIPQFNESIEFIHKCNYIHTDIKLENFLVIGTNLLQNNIVQYTKTYNIISKFPKNITPKNIYEQIDKIISNYINSITKKFDLDDEIPFDENYSSDNSDNNSSDNNNSDNNSSNNSSDNDNSDNSYDEDDTIETSNFDEDNNSNISTYSSEYGLYFNNYDNFHIKYIMEHLNYDCSSSENSENIKKDELELINKTLENPIIKLSDFDLILKKDDECYTRQIRQFRSPEIILGYKFNEKIDLWSLGQMVYELYTGNVMINPKNCDLDMKIYDLDLLHIKLLIEKTCYNKILFNDLFTLINNSKRKKYLLDCNLTLKNIKKLNCSFWIDKIKDIQINEYLKNLLFIIDIERNIKWN